MFILIYFLVGIALGVYDANEAYKKGTTDHRTLATMVIASMFVGLPMLLWTHGYRIYTQTIRDNKKAGR